MIEVVPAILEQTWPEIQKKVDMIRPYSKFIQLDVMDGVFVPNQTFRDTAKIAELDIEMEVHLMITKPSLYIQQWDLPNVKRIIFHYEAIDNMEQLIDQIRRAGKEVAVAINPETSTYEIRDYLADLDMVVVMGVEPGFSGQTFHKDVLEKIKELKQARPDLLVEVDGGVNDMTRDMIVNAGADMLAAASFLWNAEDLTEAIRVLQEGRPRV